MQEFKMPLSDIYGMFTKSELAIISWSSQEQSADLEKNRRKPARKKSIYQKRKTPEQRLAEELTGEEIEQEEYYEDNSPKDLPERFYNESGEMDLSKVTGKEAARIMGKMGLVFAPVVRSK